MKALALMLALCFASIAFASDADQFRTGVPGLQWGTTLQQARVTYPGGLTWPVEGRSANGGAIYALAGNDQMLGLSVPVRFVQLLFNKKNELEAVFFHFSYEDRDSALYDTGVLLGQEYSIKEKGDFRTYTWTLGEWTRAQVQIGASNSHPWALLAFQSATFAKANEKCGGPESNKARR